MLFVGTTGSCAGGDDTKFQSSSAVDGAEAVDGAGADAILAMPVGLKAPDAGLPFCCPDGVLGRDPDDTRAANGSTDAGCD